MKKVFSNDTFSIIEDDEGKLYIYEGATQAHSGNRGDILSWLNESYEKRMRLDMKSIENLHRKIGQLKGDIELLRDDLLDFGECVFEVGGFLRGQK